MILLADGGSTKCDWILLNKQGEVVLKTRTQGLNPTILQPKVLVERLSSSSELEKIKDSVEMLHFFGAGCSTQEPTKLLTATFEDFFKNAKEVLVREDTTAAVYAATNEPGIVCILGTGSNSVYFDGKNIINAVKSLGYIIMDEASGNYFGKRLLRDYYYKKMPQQLALEFEKNYELAPAVVEDHLYKKENPNTYLATFAEFIFKNERNEYFYKLISEGIKDFMEHRVQIYNEAQNVPLHFIGSIAFFSQDIIKDVAQAYNYQTGNFVQRPIDGLIEYYRKNHLKL